MSLRDGGTAKCPPSLELYLFHKALFRRKGQERSMKAAVTLKENYQFRQLYKKGASGVTPAMVLYCRKNKLGRNRLGLVSSTKLGHAVVRNRCRRRLREVYRLETPSMRQGYDIVLVARSRAATAPWPELQKQFRKLCRKLDLLEEKV